MNSPQAATPLYFITGFLGSGKTTLLNRVLAEASVQDKKIGVVINEWGQASVDAVLVQGRDLEIQELNNGQVFCSCLSSDFIRVLALYAERDLDAVIVETSGLANPMPLHKLLLDLRQVTGEHYDYKGMTALVDPDSFLDLVGSMAAVDEQIIASSRVIINKIDLATPEELADVRKEIASLNPRAEVIETSFGRMDGFFSDCREPEPPRPLLGFKKPSGKEQITERAADFLLRTEKPQEPGKVADFVRAVLPQALRIKGVFRDPDGVWQYVDGVNDQVEVTPLGGTSRESLIVIIPHPDHNKLRGVIRKAWLAHCGKDFSLS